jgi:uncharacterized damage-inducible protein DinB
MTNALKSKFEEKAAAIEAAVAGISEEDASRRPKEGEWSVRDVLCHLQGDAEHGFRDDLERFLKEDMPELDLSPGELYWTPEREKHSLQELAKATANQYRAIGDLMADLTPEQLERTGRIGFLKQVRGSDEIKLSEWVTVIAEYHLNQHISQLQALAAGSA